VSVGTVDFKGPPGPDGDVTVGFAFAPPHWGRGYATEAVGAIATWAFGQASVRCIEADTDTTNLRAHRVLRKLGFVPQRTVTGGMARHGDTGDLLSWRLVRPRG
jgi:RimJ/RimL family protein N-acetyltransferase